MSTFLDNIFIKFIKVIGILQTLDRCDGKVKKNMIGHCYEYESRILGNCYIIVRSVTPAPISFCQ